LVLDPSDPLENKIIKGFIFVDIANLGDKAIKYSYDLERKMSWGNNPLFGQWELPSYRILIFSWWTSRGYKPARLIGPLLEKIKIDDFSFVLILAGRSHRSSDWIETPWKEKLVIYNFNMAAPRIRGLDYFECNFN